MDNKYVQIKAINKLINIATIFIPLNNAKILETIANMIIKLNDPATNDADKGSIQTTLNSIKTRPIDFQDYDDPKYKDNKTLKPVIFWKPVYWTGLTSDQQNALTKFFGDEKQAQLAFAKFKYFRGLQSNRDAYVPERTAIAVVKNQLDQIKSFATDFENWIKTNANRSVSKILPVNIANSTWKAKFDYFTNLQIIPGSFAKTLEQSGLLSPIKQLYMIMAEWFDIDRSGTGLTISKYEKTFGGSVPNTRPKVKIQSAAIIAKVHQQTVGNSGFTALRGRYP